MGNELLIMLANGDKSAFASLYERYSPQLHRFCLKYLRDRTEAEEIVQETFIAIWEGRVKINPDQSIWSYLISIAKHNIFDHIKHKFVEIRHRDGVAESFRNRLTDEEKYLWNDIVSVMLRSMENLPKRQCEILLLRIQGYSNLEISEKLQISPRTVETHFSRALVSLRSIVSPQNMLLLMFLLTLLLKKSS